MLTATNLSSHNSATLHADRPFTMTIPRSLSQFANRRFNQPTNSFWYFTKALALRQQSINKIVEDHQQLKNIVIDSRRIWNRESQDEFSRAVKGGPATSAWARELKVFFGILGTAWVESGSHVLLTEVGEALISTDDSSRILEQQVRKYQIANPSLRTNVQGIRILPHYALIKVLLNLQNHHVTNHEFVAFVSQIIEPDKDLEHITDLLEAYRRLSATDQAAFLNRLDANKWQIISRIWPYAANFLSLPQYLNYANATITVTDERAAKQVLNWYEAGHSEHIEFETIKDWFSYYGNVSSQSTPLEAIQYYRSLRDPVRARVAYRRATERGHIPPGETEIEFFCRIQGESLLEDWLEGHLDRLETGLVFVDRQYETVDAGRLDILARDATGRYVVIELKRDLANDAAFGQLLRYMGWIRMNLADGNEVRGYVIGNEIDDRMVYGTLANDAIDRVCSLRRYSQLQVRLDISRTTRGCFAEVVDLAPGVAP